MVAGSAAFAGAGADAAVAGGFYSPFQSGPAIAASLAGASARGDDASFFYYNPASIAGAQRQEAALDARVYWPNVNVSVTHATSPVGVDITTSGNSGEVAGPTLGAASFAVMPIAPGLTLGLSGTSPFGETANLDLGWAGRFQAIHTEIRSINLTAALAYQVTPWLAVAAGPQLELLKTDFTAATLVPQADGSLVEGRGFLNGHDWAWGGVAGIVLTPFEGTRIGLSYRSNLTHELEGHAGVYLAGVARDSATYDFDLPEVVSSGLEQRLTPSLRVFAEVEWVRWSRFKGFDVSFGSGRPNAISLVEWDDTWIGALGFGWKVKPNLEVTAGVNIDTPVADGSSDSLAPDSKRLMVGLGVNGDLGNGQVLSLHYGRVMFEDVAIDLTDPTRGPFRASSKPAST